MPTSLADVFVDLRLSDRYVSPDLRRAMSSPSVTGAGTTLGTATGGKFKSSFLSSIRGLAAPIVATVGIAEISKLLRDSVDQASASQQSIGATEAVFGKYARQMIADSNAAAGQFGLSANEYREGANLIGAQLKNMSVPMKDVAGLTEGLVAKASDLAAVYGGPTSDALDAISSAMRGETDPIERYGVSLSQARIQAEELTEAHLKSVSALNDLGQAQQQTLKRQALLTLLDKQTADAQGQFQQQTSTLAEQQQILGAKIDDVEAKFGKALLPTITDLVGYVSREGVPKLNEFSDWFAKDGVPAIQDVLGELRPLGAEVVDVARDALPALIDSGGRFVGVAEDLLPLLDKGLTLFGELPGPVKDLGFAIAAIKFTGLDAGLTTLSASGRKLATDLANPAVRLDRLKSSARSLAGPLGLGLLAESFGETNDSAQNFEDVIGGALAGSTFGPWGLAVGTAVGALKAFADGSDDAAEAQRRLDTIVADLTQTLNEQTGALTAATKAKIYDQLQDKGIFDQAKEFGISQKEIIDYAVGARGALARITRDLAKDVPKQPKILSGDEISRLSLEEQHAYYARQQAYADASAAFLKFKNALIEEHDGVAQTTRDWIAKHHALGLNIVDAKAWRDALTRLPKEARTAFRQDGMDIGLVKIGQLSQRYDLTPKQVTTLIDATGYDQTVDNVNSLLRTWGVLDKTVAHPGVSVDDHGALTRLNGIRAALSRIDGTTVDASVVIHSIAAGTSSVTGHAAGGQIHGPGGPRDDLAGLFALSNREWVMPVSAVDKYGSAFMSAVQHGRLADGGPAGRLPSVHVPSGAPDDMRAMLRALNGLRYGLAQDAGAVHDEFAALIQATRKALGPDSPVVSSLAQIGQEAVDDARQRADVVAQLSKAADKLQGLEQARAQLASSTRQSFTADTFGSAHTAKGIIAFERDAVSRTRRFLKAEKKLIGEGLSRPLIRSLVGDGPDALEGAEALAAAPLPKIHELERLTGTQHRLAGDIGDRAGSYLYDAGIKAAQGVVAGLRRERDKITRELERLAEAAVREVEARSRGGDPAHPRQRGKLAEHLHLHGTDEDKIARMIEKRERQAEIVAGG